MKQELVFKQSKVKDGTNAHGTIELTLPKSLVDLGNSIEISSNGKVLPMYEGKIEFTVTLPDGTITTFAGNLALWPDKNHSKAALEAKAKADKAAKEKAEREEREKLLASFTPEQLAVLAKLGIKK